MEADLGKIVDAAIRYVGESPLKGYTFFYHLHEISDGGLEHLTSNSCVYPRLGFRPKENYERFLWLTSHEYFHLYNVKRIRPERLGPFDYTKEVYTRLLWLMEGTTDYVSLLLLRRAGLFSPTKYLEKLAGEAKKYLSTPGRHHQSLEESSLLAWIDYYRPREETLNRSISYYTKGHLVSFALDLELRERSEGKSSLQEVVQALWTGYGRPGRGIPEGAFPGIVAQATGVDIEEFARRYIAGTEELDFDRYARLAGLGFAPAPEKPEAEEEGLPGDLGAEYRVQENVVRISTVRDGGPGRRAGLAPGDELLAVDGVKILPRDFEDLLKRFPPGTSADLTLF
ncbi:MAG: PDZ domain-containing protein, partial [Thermoplasmata archaeon]|nr:PDZ domain-containing protein [Thermoplasmata archaeon]